MDIIVFDKSIYYITFHKNSRPGTIVRILSGIVNFAAANRYVFDPAIRVFVSWIETKPVSGSIMHDAIENLHVLAIASSTSMIANNQAVLVLIQRRPARRCALSSRDTQSKISQCFVG